MSYEDRPSPQKQPNIFSKVWSSVFGSDQTNTSSLPSTSVIQDFNNKHRRNRSKNSNASSVLTTGYNNKYSYYDDEDDQAYEDTRSQFSMDSSRTNNSMGIPPMTPPYNPQNDFYYTTNNLNATPYGDLNRSGSNLNNYPVSSSYRSRPTTPFSFHSVGASPYSRYTNYDDENLDDDAYMIDDTLRIINESMARWNLRPGSAKSSNGGKVGAYPTAADLIPQLPPSKDTVEQLIKKINSNNKKITQLISVSRDFIEKEEYMKLKLEFSKMKDKYEKLRGEFKLEVASGQRIADGYNELLKSHWSLNKKCNLTINKLNRVEEHLNDAKIENRKLNDQNGDLKADKIKLLREVKDLKQLNTELKRTSLGLVNESKDFRQAQYDQLKNDYHDKCNEVRKLESEKKILQEEIEEKEVQEKLSNSKPKQSPRDVLGIRRRSEGSAKPNSGFLSGNNSVGNTSNFSFRTTTPTQKSALSSPKQTKFTTEEERDENSSDETDVDPNDTIDELMKIYPDKIMPMSEVDTGISYPKVSSNWTRSD